MNREQILALAEKYRSPQGIIKMNARQFIEEVGTAISAAIESYKAELLKEVGEPVLYAEFAEDGGWLGDASEYADHLEEPHALFTSDQVAAAIIKATKPLEEEVEFQRTAHNRAMEMMLEQGAQLAAAQEELQAANSECDLFRNNGRISDANEIAELRDQLAKAEQRVAEWQPISTAPKDGTVFLGYKLGQFRECYKVPRDDCDMWCFGGTSGADDLFPNIKPTHWMPLPKAPNGASS